MVLETQTSSLIDFHFEGRDYCFSTAGENDLIHQEFLEFGTFLEIPSLEVVRSRALRGVYFDIGANLGAHTVFFANHCAATKVVAFEGNLEMARLWNRNIRLNVPEPKCRLEERFVSTHKKLSFHRDPANSGGSHVEPETGGTHESVALNDFVADNPVFLKIDVEGHEMEVLKSGMSVLEQCRPELCIEILQRENSPVFAFLRKLGYGWYGELSNANHYFIYDARPWEKTVAKFEDSKSGVLRSVGWRLRVLLAAYKSIMPWADALKGIIVRKNLRDAVLIAIRGK